MAALLWAVHSDCGGKWRKKNGHPTLRGRWRTPDRKGGGTEELEWAFQWTVFRRKGWIVEGGPRGWNKQLARWRDQIRTEERCFSYTPTVYVSERACNWGLGCLIEHRTQVHTYCNSFRATVHNTLQSYTCIPVLEHQFKIVELSILHTQSLPMENSRATDTESWLATAWCWLWQLVPTTE